jgi:hypothetical protein
MRGALGATAALVLMLAVTACGGSSKPGSAGKDKVPEVVSGSTWTGVAISNGATTVDVTADARQNLVPLLATRLLNPAGPLPEYGLDHPQALLTYKTASGATADVDIGQPNFDHHFVYVQRRGRPGVYLVPLDTLRPALALVGIEIKPPE